MKAASEAYGEMLFMLSRVGKAIGADPEQTLSAATEAFIDEFEKAEAEAEKKNISLGEMFKD